MARTTKVQAGRTTDPEWAWDRYGNPIPPVGASLEHHGPERAAYLLEMKRNVVGSAEQFSDSVAASYDYRATRWQLVRSFGTMLSPDGYVANQDGGYTVACLLDAPGRKALVYGMMVHTNLVIDRSKLVWLEVPRDRMRASLDIDIAGPNAGQTVAQAVGSLFGVVEPVPAPVAPKETEGCGRVEPGPE